MIALPSRSRLSAEELTRRATALTVAESAKPAKPPPPIVNAEERGGCGKLLAVVETDLATESALAAEPPPTTAPTPVAPAPPAASPDRLLGQPADRWVVDGGGIARWRPQVDRLDVTDLGGGERVLVLTSGFRLTLDPACAAHLAMQLMPEEWRVALLGRLGEGR